MATADQIASLRLLIAEPTPDPYTDVDLGSRIDSSTSIDAVAYDIWTEKAAATAQLVNITEGGSTRDQSNLYRQALAMAEVFRERALSPDTPPDGNVSGVRVKRIVRP